MGSDKIEDNNMTLEEAKEIYKKNNCSLFVMAREDMENYILYKNLNVDRVHELEWKIEKIEELVKALKESGDILIFNRLYELAMDIHDQKRFLLMMKLIDDVRVEDVTTSLCLAETIMGRKILSVKSGMIFWAYDLNLKNEVRILIRKVQFLIGIQTSDEEEEVRISRDQRKIREIIAILGIELDND